MRREIPQKGVGLCSTGYRHRATAHSRDADERSRRRIIVGVSLGGEISPSPGGSGGLGDGLPAGTYLRTS
jgi:hypothetical protein